MQPYSVKVKNLIHRIPEGKVCTYGIIAAAAGNPRGARQVFRILHSSARKDNLPWHRVINRKGTISLRRREGYEIQKQLLQSEGIEFNHQDCIDFDVYLWIPETDCKNDDIA